MINRVLIDTNCFLVIVPKRSPFRWIYDKILSGDLELVVSTEIILEYEEQLTRFYSREYAETVVKVLVNLPNVFKVNPISFNWLLISDDPDDDKFVDAYVASNGDLIVTNDRHFKILESIKFPPISICKITDFKNFHA